MNQEELQSKLMLLDQRAEKATWCSKGLWAMGAVLLFAGVAMLAWAGLHEPIDFVAVQVPPAIEAALHSLDSPQSFSGTSGAITDALTDLGGQASTFFRVVSLVTLLFGAAVAVLKQSFVPGFVSIALALSLGVLSQMLISDGSSPERDQLQKLKVAIELRNVEAVQTALSDESLRLPSIQAEYLWWQVAALSAKTKGIDFGPILTSFETRAMELKPTPGVRYALETHALGAPRSEEAVAFKLKADQDNEKRLFMGKLVMLVGVVSGLLAACVTIVAGSITRRVDRIRGMGLLA